MKKSNSFLNSKNNNLKEDNIFESMKKLLHFPANQIKSNDLLNVFTNNKFSNLSNRANQSEYSLILNQKKKELGRIARISANHSLMNYNKILKNKEKNIKNSFLNNGYKSNLEGNNVGYNLKITESYDSSYNYNNKVGMNAPQSFNELDNNNSSIGQKVDNEKNKDNLIKNDNFRGNIFI